MKNVGLLFSLWLGSAVATQNDSTTSSPLSRRQSRGESAPEVLAAGNDDISFRVEGWNGSACGNDGYRDLTVADGRAGVCFNTNGEVGSFAVAAEGSCPDGHVQVSYWEEADCDVGKWHGYDYTSRSSHCRPLPSGGQRFQSVLLRCQAPEAVGQDGVQHGKRTGDSAPEDDEFEDEDVKARFNIINDSGHSQQVYMVGRAKGRWAFVKRDGSIVRFEPGFQFASVAMHLDRGQKVSFDVERPFLEGRLYAASRDPGFTTWGSGIGWPACPSRGATGCNFIEFQNHGEDVMNTLSAGGGGDGGVPQLRVEIKAGNGETKSGGGVVRWAKEMTVTLVDS